MPATGTDDGVSSRNVRHVGQDGLHAGDHVTGYRSQVDHVDAEPFTAILEQQNSDSERIVLCGKAVQREQVGGKDDLRAAGAGPED